MIVLAGVALKPRKALRQDATAQEALERLVDERRRAAFVARDLRKRRALCGDQAIEHGLGGVARHVLSRRRLLCGAGEHATAQRKERAARRPTSLRHLGAPTLRGRWRLASDRGQGYFRLPPEHVVEICMFRAIAITRFGGWRSGISAHDDRSFRPSRSLISLLPVTSLALPVWRREGGGQWRGRRSRS